MAKVSFSVRLSYIRSQKKHGCIDISAPSVMTFTIFQKGFLDFRALP